ncbi:MAG: helix-turn-helix domain-containing protein [Methanomassiliicoccales archaeon]
MTAPLDSLIKLGFSEYEAKAYVAIVSVTEGGISEISQKSGIPRSRVYDIMERLASKGFVEVGATKPLRYRAIDPDKVISQIRLDLMRTLEEAEAGLKELRSTNEKASMPLWLLQGEGTIDQEVAEFIERATPTLSLLAMSRSLLLRHAKAIADRSKVIRVDVLVFNDPEVFFGKLGRANVMKLPQATATSLDWILSPDPQMDQKEQKIRSELVLISGNNSLLVYREDKVRKAMRVEGTIIGRFIFAFAERVIQDAQSM